MTLLDRAEIVALLRQLDDPVHLEWPPHFDNGAERRRFRSLTTELGRRFGCAGQVEVDAQVQDASFLGQLVVPASATAKGVAIFVRVSNFGGLALVGAEGPGQYDDTETLDLIAAADLESVLGVLAVLGYVPLLEDVLSSEYDGASDVLREAYPSYPPTWFIRYFDYL